MHSRVMTVFAVALFAIAAGVGCSSGPTQNAVPAAFGGRHHGGKRADNPGAYIQHIFIIVQENRSLNNLFAGFPGANTTMTGCMREGDGYGSGSGSGSGSCPVGDKSVALQSVRLATTQDIDHCYVDAVTAIYGPSPTPSPLEQMDGFNYEYQGGCGSGTTLAKKLPYAYVQQSDIKPYWDIANNWVLAANFYPTELGPSFVAHVNLLAGTTEYQHNVAVADYPRYEPWGCDYHGSPANNMRWLTPTVTPSPYTGPTPCYSQFHTIADELDSPPPINGGNLPPSPIPWRYYAPNSGQNGYIWSAFDAINRVRNGPDWNNDVVPNSPSYHVLADIPGGALDETGVVWVVPNYKYSDHAGFDTDEGPSWVGDIVNAIGKRTALWNHSVIIVLWDDWGGWYDNAPPPAPNFRGEGIRTPMLILSPYAKQAQTTGHVSLTYFNPGSILKFIEETFNLQPLGTLPCNGYGSGYGSGYGAGRGCGLGYTDANANSLDSVFNWSQTPRPFGTPIPTKYGPKFFEKGCGTSSGSGCRYGSGYGSEYAYPPDDE